MVVSDWVQKKGETFDTSNVAIQNDITPFLSRIVKTFCWLGLSKVRFDARMVINLREVQDAECWLLLATRRILAQDYLSNNTRCRACRAASAYNLESL